MRLPYSDPAGVDTTDMPPELKGRETIVVKGQRIEQKLSDVSGSITVITEEDLDRQVATGLTDVFKNEPGVSVTGTSKLGMTSVRTSTARVGSSAGVSA